MGPNKALDVVNSLGSHKNGNDILVWTDTVDGKFSTKSAWSHIRFRVPKVAWFHWVWHPCLPKKIYVLVWKAFHNALSVDDQVHKLGISIVSRCNCCSTVGYEDLNHVLAIGEFARDVVASFSFC